MRFSDRIHGSHGTLPVAVCRDARGACRVHALRAGRLDVPGDRATDGAAALCRLRVAVHPRGLAAVRHRAGDHRRCRATPLRADPVCPRVLHGQSPPLASLDGDSSGAHRLLLPALPAEVVVARPTSLGVADGGGVARMLGLHLHRVELDREPPSHARHGRMGTTRRVWCAPLREPRVLPWLALWFFSALPTLAIELVWQGRLLGLGVTRPPAAAEVVLGL